MPLVQKSDGQPAAKPYGVQPNSNTMTLQERLMKRFAAHEFVRVKNIDDERLVWQYLPAHEEEHEYTSDPMKNTRRGMPEVWEINPGEEDIIVGANAYLMIDALYKKVAAKRKFSEQAADGVDSVTSSLSFSFDDGGQQEAIIDQIYLGKANPTFGPTEQAPAVQSAGQTYEAKKTGAIGASK